MSDFIDDEIIEAGQLATGLDISYDRMKNILEAVLPMIGEKLATDFANGTKPNYIIVVDDVVARIRELTRKP